jgi:hypothetical protein
MSIAFHIDSGRFGLFQAISVGSLVALGGAAYLVADLTGHRQLFGLIPLLDVGNENGLATFFSSLNLLCAALVSYLIYATSDKDHRVERRWAWLAGVFVYLALDEACVIHENFSRLHEIVGNQSVIQSRHGWLIFGFPFALIAAVLFVPLLFQLRRSTAMLFVFGGCLFGVGSIGFELIGSLMIDEGIGVDTLAYDLRRVAEEGLEMSGIALYNWAAVRELAVRQTIASVTLTRQSMAAAEHIHTVSPPRHWVPSE